MSASTGVSFFRRRGIEWSDQAGVHDTSGRGRSANAGEQLRLDGLRAKIERLLQVGVEAGAYVDVLRMNGKLRHREAFQPVHFSGLVDLLLQVGPLCRICWRMALTFLDAAS